MRITLNGEPREVADSTTLRELVEHSTPPGSACAAEVNKDLVPRRKHQETVLREGDTVELVTLVGGG